MTILSVKPYQMRLFFILIIVLTSTHLFSQIHSTETHLIYSKKCGLIANNKFEEGGECYIYFKKGVCIFNISKILKSPAIFNMINYRNNRIGDSCNYEIHFQWDPKNSSSILFNIIIRGSKKFVGIDLLQTGAYCNFSNEENKKMYTEIMNLFNNKLKVLK